MENIFATGIKINKVRHLKDITIDLSKEERKHLILTGKNGSGKTSVLDALASFLDGTINSDKLLQTKESIKRDENNLKYANKIKDEQKIGETIARLNNYKEQLEKISLGVDVELNDSFYNVHQMLKNGDFVAAYYKADRVFQADTPKHVEKIMLKTGYSIKETPREDFIKYLLDMKMTQALAISNNKKEKAEKIKTWFDSFEQLLKKIFEDDSVQLEFDEDTFQFRILMEGREPFDFNTLSSGYAAVLDIVVDLIIRMEKQANRVFDFSVQGIVLIDEIETHLHLELQRKILDLLTTIFPNIQFIITTHSPFILNSLENVVIYDLEKQLLAKDGLTEIPYEGIVEGYFDSDRMSQKLREKYEEYKKLANKPELSDDDFEKIADLEVYLEEIPDYLALEITTEYQRLKAQLRNREDV